MARQAQRAPGAVRGGIARDEQSVLFGGARRRRLLGLALLVLLLAGAAAAVIWVRPAAAQSRAVGDTNDGRLVRGVQLPPEGLDFFTWDAVNDVAPNRGWRRWGTDVLIDTVLGVLAEYRTTNLGVPRVGIEDLSRRHGGPFGPRYGGLGHASHQNGLDVDIAYPRLDERERPPQRPELVDLERAQDLVDRFVAAGAQKVFVGPSLGLRGPKKVVIALVHHDDHMHVRVPPPPD